MLKEHRIVGEKMVKGWYDESIEASIGGISKRVNTLLSHWCALGKNGQGSMHSLGP